MTLQYVAMLPPELLARLQEAGAAHDWHTAPLGDDLVNRHATNRHTLAVIDPAWQNGVAICQSFLKSGQATVVCYTAFAPRSVELLLKLARIGPFITIFHDARDESAELANALERSRHLTEVAVILDRFKDGLSSCPLALSAAIQELFDRPSRFRAGIDLAFAANMSCVSVYRHLADAGLPPAKRLLVAARFVAARHYFSQGQQSLRLATRRAGYAYMRVFKQDARRIFGDVRGDCFTMPELEFCDGIIEWLISR
jgi:hypothetical protein